jgi:hypothetical protein
MTSREIIGSDGCCQSRRIKKDKRGKALTIFKKRAYY